MNYPNKKSKSNNNYIEYGNRGMTLESDINSSNKYYLDNDVAVIYKKPTPVKVTKVNYTSNKITEGYYEIPSTTDYNGIYKGNYIDFEAKETKSKTSFSLSNIHEHQIRHLIRIKNHGGISFIIIRFVTLGKTYLIFTKDFESYINNNDRKSIPLSYIEDKGYLIKERYNPILDYLSIIDQMGDEHGKI